MMRIARTTSESTPGGVVVIVVVVVVVDQRCGPYGGHAVALLGSRLPFVLHTRRCWEDVRRVSHHHHKIANRTHLYKAHVFFVLRIIHSYFLCTWTRVFSFALSGGVEGITLRPLLGSCRSAVVSLPLPPRPSPLLPLLPPLPRA
jgi:hypothetical protein